MPKGKKLSDYEKGQIDALSSTGKSAVEIGKSLGRTKDVIKKYLKNPRQYGTAKHTGRPSKLSSREKRRILKVSSNSTISCNKIKSECGLGVSKTTVWRVLNNNPNIVRSKMVTCPKLKPAHKLARMEFAREHMTWSHEWQHVIFSDEKSSTWMDPTVTTHIGGTFERIPGIFRSATLEEEAL